MANYYEITNLPSARFVLPTSRYIGSKVAYYTERKLLTFQTYKRGSYIATKSDQYWVIEKGYEYRPDLISNQKYGTPDFWWKILEANGMKDILEFKTGTNIILPQQIYA